MAYIDRTPELLTFSFFQLMTSTPSSITGEPGGAEPTHARTHAHTGKMPDKPASHRPSAVDTAVRNVVKASAVSPTLKIAADHRVGHAPAPTRDVLARLGPSSHANRKLLGMTPLPKRSMLRQLFLDESQHEADEERLQVLHAASTEGRPCAP